MSASKMKPRGTTPLRSLAVLTACLAVGAVLAGCGGDKRDDTAQLPRTEVAPDRLADRDTTGGDRTPAGGETAPGAGATEQVPASPEPAVMDETPAAGTPAGGTPAAASATMAPPQTAAAERGRYSLQLGSFRRPANADRLVARLRELGRAPVVEQVTVGGQTHQRVLLTGFDDRDEARRAGEDLRNRLGVDYLIVSNK